MQLLYALSSSSCTPALSARCPSLALQLLSRRWHRERPHSHSRPPPSRKPSGRSPAPARPRSSALYPPASGARELARCHTVSCSALACQRPTQNPQSNPLSTPSQITSSRRCRSVSQSNRQSNRKSKSCPGTGLLPRARRQARSWLTHGLPRGKPVGSQVPSHVARPKNQSDYVVEPYQYIINRTCTTCTCTQPGTGTTLLFVSTRVSCTQGHPHYSKFPAIPGNPAKIQVESTWGMRIITEMRNQVE